MTISRPPTPTPPSPSSRSSASATATAAYAPYTAHREQRRGAALPVVALRRSALRDRAVRALALRDGSRARTGSSPCFVDEPVAQVTPAQPGESTGYGRRFVAEAPTWIGLVPVGYGDGFRRS